MIIYHVISCQNIYIITAWALEKVILRGINPIPTWKDNVSCKIMDLNGILAILLLLIMYINKS